MHLREPLADFEQSIKSRRDATAIDELIRMASHYRSDQKGCLQLALQRVSIMSSATLGR